MEVNKVAAGVFGTLLVFLGLGFFAEQIFHPHHNAELAFALEIETDEVEAEEVEEIDLTALFAAADPTAGEKVFKKCAACHKLDDGANGLGPHLWNIVNRPIASVDGFGYSDAFPVDEAWTGANLFAFLEAPKKWAEGTKMNFKGLNKAKDRADLIAYLNEVGGSPEPLE